MVIHFGTNRFLMYDFELLTVTARWPLNFTMISQMVRELVWIKKHTHLKPHHTRCAIHHCVGGKKSVMMLIGAEELETSLYGILWEMQSKWYCGQTKESLLRPWEPKQAHWPLLSSVTSELIWGCAGLNGGILNKGSLVYHSTNSKNYSQHRKAAAHLWQFDFNALVINKLTNLLGMVIAKYSWTAMTMTYSPRLQVGGSVFLGNCQPVLDVVELLVDTHRLQFLEVHHPTELVDHHLLTLVLKLRDLLVEQTSVFHQIHMLPLRIATRQTNIFPFRHFLAV